MIRPTQLVRMTATSSLRAPVRFKGSYSVDTNFDIKSDAQAEKNIHSTTIKETLFTPQPPKASKNSDTPPHPQADIRDSHEHGSIFEQLKEKLLKAGQRVGHQVKEKVQTVEEKASQKFQSIKEELVRDVKGIEDIEMGRMPQDLKQFVDSLPSKDSSKAATAHAQVKQPRNVDPPALENGVFVSPMKETIPRPPSEEVGQKDDEQAAGAEPVIRRGLYDSEVLYAEAKGESISTVVAHNFDHVEKMELDKRWWKENLEELCVTAEMQSTEIKTGKWKGRQWADIQEAEKDNEYPVCGSEIQGSS